AWGWARDTPIRTGSGLSAAAASGRHAGRSIRASYREAGRRRWRATSSRTCPASRRRRGMGLLRARCCRFLHPAEGDATPVRFPLEHCFDAFGPEAGDHTLHEREVRTADEIVVLTRQGSEGAVAEDQ